VHDLITNYGRPSGRSVWVYPRSELNRMLDQLRQGDVVIVGKLDRLARSTRNLLEIVELIGNVGAGFQSISEPFTPASGQQFLADIGELLNVHKFPFHVLRQPRIQTATVILSAQQGP
jgi:DNA invertase Pin-like site-specific DNA recombinase